MDKKDKVEMVGHELLGDNLDSRIVDGYFFQLVEDCTAQWGGMDNGFMINAVARDAGKQRTAVIHDECNHVDTTVLIVVTSATALHRRDGRAVPIGLAVFILWIVAHHVAKLLQVPGIDKPGGYFFNDGAT